MIVTLVKVFLGIAAFALLVSSVLMLFEDMALERLEGQRETTLTKIGVFCFKNAKYLSFFGIACNAVVVAIHWTTNGYVPFISMWQVLAFLGITFPLTYLYIKYVRKTDVSYAWFVLCSGVCMLGCCFMEATMIWHRPPALQSPFFLPHILCYMLSYSLCAVGFVLTLVMIFTKDAEKKAELEKAAYSIIITGFPFMVAGMFLGAIWANECWGNFWSWDPKETWALITTCLYALYFHIRKHKTLKKFVIPVLIIAFLALLMTFVGINLFGLNGQHSYNM